MSNLTLENIVSNETTNVDRALQTCQQIVDSQLPNLFRLHLNPYVAQVCYCLSMMTDAHLRKRKRIDPNQVFLCNGYAEAVSGAIKLARFTGRTTDSPVDGLIIDRDLQLEHFANTQSASGTGRRSNFFRM